MLGLGVQHEARVARELGVALVVVVIDPAHEPIAELLVSDPSPRIRRSAAELLRRSSEFDAANLERLYEYIQQRLAAGLAERSDEALAEAGGLLQTLAEGWRDASDSRKGAMKRPEPRAEEAELALAGAGRSWTV